MLKLPKNIQSPEDLELLKKFFSSEIRSLRDDKSDSALVSLLRFDDLLQAALEGVAGTGHLLQGLERITIHLDKEKKGLDLAQGKTGQPSSPRMSRLLLLSGDGTSRFYRDADALLCRHANRLWGCLLETDSETLGVCFAQKKKPTKALLIDDRDALGLCLNQMAKGLKELNQTQARTVTKCPTEGS